MKSRYIVLCALPLIALFFYSTPWLIAATRFNLGLYLLSFIWFFFVAWIMGVIILFKAVKNKIKNNNIWKSYSVVALFILIGYAGLFIFLYKGYFVTV